MALELNMQAVTTPPLPAATVVMLREGNDKDSNAGFSVLLLKRHSASDVLGGAYVFPGGKVDPSDTALQLDTHLDQTPHDLHRALAEDDIDTLTAAGLFVAALREAFEECGVLFSHHTQSGWPLNAINKEANNEAKTSAIPLGSADSLRLRAALRSGTSFNQLLVDNALCLDSRSVVPWSRWITPVVPAMMRKRFDTRFFVAIAPPSQLASHDNHEATESVWLPPREALAQYWQGQIELAPPQIMSLAHLAHFATAADVLAAARQRPPPVIRPEHQFINETRTLCYPGDPLHSVREQALPGPTRLSHRSPRFEPDGGFEAFFA